MKYFIFVVILETLLNIVYTQDIPTSLCDGVPTGEFVRDCKTSTKCQAAGPIHATCHQCYSCPEPTKLLAFYPVDNSCTRYIRCLSGVASEHICDVSLQFNRASGQCESEADVGCAVSDVLRCPKNIQPGSFFAVNMDTDCSIGLICVGVTDPFVIICKQGLHFNTKTLGCGLPDNSGCMDRNTAPYTTPKPSSPTASTSTTAKTSTTPNPEVPPGEIFF